MLDYVRIEISPLTPTADVALLHTAHSLGLTALEAIAVPTKLYFVAHPEINANHVDTLCQKLLTDPVTERLYWEYAEDLPTAQHDLRAGVTAIEVAYLPGVTDRVAYELEQAARILDLPPLKAATGLRYTVYHPQEVAESVLQQLARHVLCNEVVQRYQIGLIEPSFITPQPTTGEVEQIQLADLEDEALVNLSQTRRLALNQREMQVLRDFSRQVNRPLTEAELEMVAQTWSEHCFHKTFKAKIRYQEIDSSNRKVIHEETIDGLLKATIRAATEACQKDWIVSAFVDNAGIVRFDDEYVLSFKAETHNHPSALEPFGGANTGVGGVIRDILGVSAKPIALTDVLCFGPQDLPLDQLPDGMLHPTRVQQGVVAGVGDYGNKMGIPTVNGAVIYNEGYIANPLVYCGCVGLAPTGSHVTQPQVGDHLIVLGGLTGRDGLRGATFSSLDLDSQTNQAEFASTAVQIGDPIVEKDVQEVVMLARDAGLYNAITDCGAGGLSSAIGEMAQTLGAEIFLERVSLKYSGLRPWEIWLSEAQERMVLSVPSQNLAELATLCERYGVNWDDIGTMTGDGQMRVRYHETAVVDLPMDLLHEQHPQLELTAVWSPVMLPDPPANAIGGVPRQLLDDIDPEQALYTMLADPNIAPKEGIIRTYDHEVQGGTVIKPLVGVGNRGPSDGAVIKPFGTSGKRGIALSNGINPRYGLLDPYRMAVSAVDEAVRNVVAVGGNPDELSLLDNFCWGNPNLPDRLGSLVRAAKGCHDGARAFDAPFISGKDSLNNEYVDPNGQRRPIPGTLLISAVAIVPDIEHTVTMDLKSPGNAIYLIGKTKSELGGSLLAEHYNLPATDAPTLPVNALETARRLHQAIRQGLVVSCHDLSEGGLAVAAAEMASAGGWGISLDVDVLPADTSHPIVKLFSESNGRWLVEVPARQHADFEAVMRGSTCVRCGQVTALPHISLLDQPFGSPVREVVSISLLELA